MLQLQQPPDLTYIKKIMKKGAIIMKKDLYFEELEEQEELGDVQDFIAAATPLVVAGLTLAGTVVFT